ncbi:hypothetical protein [Nocardia transvalensis]|uniref:hypothetical protein n=1 Tax=Nocardia transvalensis TaxID=37333 RepID=UPI001895FB7C|nr:hypothetical protein [Nocardia transvalensis]MBF6327486.1 hypothetical protein [Nocardia transvalensis]
MRMDVPATQAIARELKSSAQVVNDSARQIAGAVQAFAAADAGSEYRTQGDRIGRALGGIGQRLYAWANCVHDTGTALDRAAASNENVDRSSSAALAAVGSELV